MLNALLIHDLADAIVRERQQQAAQQALVAQLAAVRWGFDSRDGFRLIRH